MNLPEYKTADIVLAAFLRVSGYQIDEIEKQGLKGTFVFTNVDEALIRSYDLGQSLVEPVALNNMIKQLTTSVRRID